MYKKIILATMLVVLIIILSACNVPAASPTPDTNLAYTQVAQTFEARRTEEALLTPSSTPSPTPTVTNTPQPATNTPEAVTPTNTLPAYTNTPAPSTSADRCTYISQNVADNSTFQPGASIAITWTLQNTGTTTWTTEYSVRYYAGNIMGAAAQSQLTKEVKPDEKYDVSMTFTAPSTPDTYNTIWVLTNPAASGGINFCSFNLIIKVQN